MRNVSSWAKMTANQIVDNDLVPIIDMSEAGRDRNKAVQIDQLINKIKSGLPRSSEIDSLFAAAQPLAVPRKKADGSGIEYYLPPRMLGAITAASAITGTTTETQHPGLIVVPANTLKDGSVFSISALWSSNNTANNKTHIIRIGNQAVLNWVATAAYQSFMTQRICFCQAGRVVSFTVNSSGSFGSDTAGTFNSFVLDYGVDNDITFSAQLANAGDTVTLQAASARLL